MPKRKPYIYSLFICSFLTLIFNLTQEDIQSIKLLANLRNAKIFKYFSKSMYTVASVRIIVLTWTRPKSLRRLLTSLQNSSYKWPGSPDISIYLDIHIDGGGDGLDKNNTILIAQQFNCTFGPKTVIIHEENRGLMKSWLTSCVSSPPGEYCLIAEDDIELSPHWFRFLVNMWTAFNNRADLAGISLNKQTYRMKWTGPVKGGRIVDSNPVFLYKMVGSWGFSPHPILWTKFTEEQKNISDPRMKGFMSNAWWQNKGRVWTTYFYWWCEKYDLYTLYFNNGDRVLSRTWNEKGVHSHGAYRKNFPLVQEWNVAWNYNNITQGVNCYSFDLIRVSRKPQFENETFV